MKEFISIISVFLLFFSPAKATVIVNTELPREYGTFGVKITAKETDEVIVFIPQCIGGLGIKVENGNKYTIKTDPNCSIDVPYEPIRE